jgi:hypothetical protein
LKAEIQKLKDANEIASIKTSCADTPAADLRNMMNACKLRNDESIGDLAILFKKPRIKLWNHQIWFKLMQFLPMIFWKASKRCEGTKNWKINRWSECDKANIHSKELPQTKIHTEIMQQSLEKQFAEAREDKVDLEKTYCYVVHEIKKKSKKN